jgi:hypothetical protein
MDSCLYNKICVHLDTHFHILYILRFIFIMYIVLYCILTTSDSSGSVRDSSKLSI